MGCKAETVILITLSIGALVFSLGFILGYVAFPKAIDAQVKKNLDLWDLESEGRKNFMTPPVDLYMKIYLFHILNPENVSDGTEMPRFEEIGPFTYREVRIKEEVSEFDEDTADNIEFGQYKAFVFEKDLSCDSCFEDRNMTFINAPLLGVVNILKKRVPPILREPLITLFNKAINGELNILGLHRGEYRDELFFETTVGEYLFSGTKPGSVQLVLDLVSCFLTGTHGAENNGKSGSAICQLLGDLGIEEIPPLPPVLAENGFAIFNNKNDTTRNEWYSMNTGYSDMKKYYDLEKWGPSLEELSPDLTPAGWWKENGGYMGSNDCNTLIGTDGQQFHPDIQREERLWIFQTDVCRSMYMEYEEDVDIDGIEALRFIVNAKALQLNTTFNLGFCMEIYPNPPNGSWETCPKETSDPEVLDLSDCNIPPRMCPDSVMDLTSCMAGAPVITSSPYFFHSPEHLRRDVSLPEPDEALHETRLDVEPVSGAALIVHKRLQINIPLVQLDDITVLNDILRPDEEYPIIIYPLLWLDEGADIDEENIELVQDMVTKPIKLTVVFQWLLVALGACAIVIAAGAFIYRKKKNVQYV